MEQRDNRSAPPSAAELNLQQPTGAPDTSARMFGPSVHVAVTGFAASWVSWILLTGLMLMLFVWSGSRAQWVYESLPYPLSRWYGNWWSGGFSAARIQYLIVGLLLMGVWLCRWIIVWRTMRYYIDGDYFIVEYGWLNPYSPAGLFRFYRDPIPMPLMVDCDSVQTLSGRTFGCGTLLPRTMDGQRYAVRSVLNPSTASSMLMQRSRVHQIKLMASAGGAN